MAASGDGKNPTHKEICYPDPLIQSQAYSRKKNYFCKKATEAVGQRCSVEKYVSKACSSIKKETLAQVFSCELCEIIKNTLLYGTYITAASEAP